ncbi:MAG: bacteriorhodopsin [Chlamydiota bacterium]
MIQPSMENFFNYDTMQFQMVSHILTFGFAVMLAALFYFVMTIKSVAKRFRISSVLSVVVMVSAFLILYFQAASWQNAFTFNSSSGLYQPRDGYTFTNGYRYLNWLIDVPMLLYQILFIIDLEAVRRNSLRNQFFFSGCALIILGYIGQFYETSNLTYLWIYGLVSTAFFFHVIYLIYKVISSSYSYLTPPAKKYMSSIWWLFLISWWLYPVAYIMPVFFNTAWGAVTRQLLFTGADIASKVIYGIFLTQVAMIRTKDENLEVGG